MLLDYVLVGCILELVLKRQRVKDAPFPNSLIGMIKDSLGGVRYVEYMRPEQQQQQQDGEQQDEQEQEGEQGGEGGEEDAAAAAEGGEGEAAAAEEDAAAEAEGGEQQQQQQEEGGEEELRYMVRFQAADVAAAALAAFEGQEAAADGSKQVAGLPATLRAVDGEEEEAYHKRVSCCCAPRHAMLCCISCPAMLPVWHVSTRACCTAASSSVRG